MESSRFAYYMTKYMPFVIALIFISIPLLGHLFPGNVTFNGEPGPPDKWDAALFISIGVLVGLVPFLYLDKLVMVQMNHQNIRILKDDVVEVSWLDVESVGLLQFVTPPLYKLRLKNYDGYFLFHTSAWAVTFMGATWDPSDMGALIKKKKRELGI